MSHLFSYDSPVWKFLGRIADFFVLTILAVVTSLPIFTIGASLTAVYSITLKMTEDKEGYLFRTYFKAFKENFKEAVLLWLPTLFVGLVLAGDFFICNQMTGPMAVMLFWSFVVLAAVYLMFITYLFPIVAKTRNTLSGYVKVTFYLCIRYFSWTILLVVIPLCIVAVGIWGFWPLLLFSIGLAAYLQSLIFTQIFKQQNWEMNDEE